MNCPSNDSLCEDEPNNHDFNNMKQQCAREREREREGECVLSWPRWQSTQMLSHLTGHNTVAQRGRLGSNRMAFQPWPSYPNRPITSTNVVNSWKVGKIQTGQKVNFIPRTLPSFAIIGSRDLLCKRKSISHRSVEPSCTFAPWPPLRPSKPF